MKLGRRLMFKPPYVSDHIHAIKALGETTVLVQQYCGELTPPVDFTLEWVFSVGVPHSYAAGWLIIVCPSALLERVVVGSDEVLDLRIL